MKSPVNKQLTIYIVFEVNEVKGLMKLEKGKELPLQIEKATDDPSELLAVFEKFLVIADLSKELALKVFVQKLNSFLGKHPKDEEGQEIFNLGEGLSIRVQGVKE